MNYRHIFHAGNFADVFKHAVLVQLLRQLQRKDKGLAYIETHAGAGRYNLQSPDAAKTAEYRDGIGRFWDAPLPTAAPLATYLSAVRTLNGDGHLRYYPGSPRIAHFLLRPQDGMRLAEKSPADCARLQREFVDDARVVVMCGDGYGLLNRWLPPPQRRGLVLVDPPFERGDEWERLVEALIAAAKRWREGTYAVWYPLKALAPTARFKAALAESGLRKLLLVELALWPLDSPFRLNGCGMLIHNPPWRFEAELQALSAPLVDGLGQGPGAQFTVSWLVPE